MFKEVFAYGQTDYNALLYGEIKAGQDELTGFSAAIEAVFPTDESLFCLV